MKTFFLASVTVVALSGFALAGGASSGPPGETGEAGLGNATASVNPGRGDGAGRSNTSYNGNDNFIGSHAESASKSHGVTSDIGEGRERADEANPNGDGCHCD